MPIYEVAGKRVDLDRALPLTLGDLVEMEKRGFRQGSETPLSTLAIFVAHITRKANPDVTEADVLGISPLDPMVVELGRWLREGVPNGERPTPASSSG